MKKSFSNYKLIKYSAFIINLLLLFSVSSPVMAGTNVKENAEIMQQGTVRGTVTDFEGNSLPGVTVVIQGSSRGTTTDIDGNYVLQNVTGSDILVFSFVGMSDQEITVGNQRVINTTMEEETIGLQEVIAIGYGVQRKENVIGSVTSVSGEDLSSAPVSMVSNALAGRLSGAIIQQDTGEPGENFSSILIRGNTTLGNSTPLVVIDGIPDRDLNSVSPSDIESITILKDASAAIYGARSANGVILVTTKRGSLGRPTLSYSFYKGILTPTRVPEMADAATYATMIREMQSYRNVSENNMMYSLEDIEKYRSGEFPWTHPNTDWFAEGLRKSSSTSNHNISVNGGTDKVNYYGSFSANNSDGIYKNSASFHKRYNVKAAIDADINEYISVGIDLGGSQATSSFPTRGQGVVFEMLRRSKPTDHAFFPNGLPGPDIEYGDNPVVISGTDPGTNERTVTRINSKFSLTLNIPQIPGLSLSSYFSYDRFFRVSKLWEKPFTLYSLDTEGYLNAGNTGKEDGSDFIIANFPKGQAPEPRLSDSYSDSESKLFNVSLNFERTFNEDHNFNGFVAMETSEYFGKGIEAFRRYFLSDQLPYLFAGGTKDWTNDGYASHDSRLNYFGRLMYNYKEKYLLQFALRRDGSLNFSKESGRWGLFPSVLAGWRISSEDFWKVSQIEYMKLRASFGMMGNDHVSPYQYLTSYEYGTGVVFGSGYSTSLIQSGTPNPFITWEKANIFNAGFESTLFKNITLNTDFFYQRRSDILVERQASVPDYTGIDLPDENFGIVDTKGFEFELGYRNRVGEFKYNINSIFSYAKNIVVEYDEPARNVPWQVRTGHPYGVMLLYKSGGIFRDEAHVNSLPHVPGARPGDIIIVDYDDDGEITADDRVLFDDTADPKMTFGVNIDLQYRNWGLSALIQGAGKTLRSIASDAQTGSIGNYFAYEAEDRWTPTNTDASKPRAYEREEEYWRVNYETDYNYQPGAYARVKNISLSYSIPKRILTPIKIQGIKLHVSADNAFLIFNQNKILDPEARDMESYPIMRTFTLGGQITF
jgi:TonB-linked SusC/RagA family outer membrane protein